MRKKKRYVLFASMPTNLPSDARLLFQNEFGYVVKMDLKTSIRFRKDAILISGSIAKLKNPKVLNRGKTKS